MTLIDCGLCEGTGRHQGRCVMCEGRGVVVFPFGRPLSDQEWCDYQEQMARDHAVPEGKEA